MARIQKREVQCITDKKAISNLLFDTCLFFGISINAHYILIEMQKRKIRRTKNLKNLEQIERLHLMIQIYHQMKPIPTMMYHPDKERITHYSNPTRKNYILKVSYHIGDLRCDLFRIIPIDISKHNFYSYLKICKILQIF